MENIHELLAIGTEGLRRVRSALAPDWSYRWHLLLQLLDPLKQVSTEAEAFGRTTQADAVFVMRLYSHASWRLPMSAAVVPLLWASQPPSEPLRDAVGVGEPIPFEMAFYRKYTEGILRRYVRLSLEAGKVPSLLGQEMFRGKVTSYRVGSFVDSVIFVHDVERCVARLDEEQQHLITRIALHQYTLGETAKLMGLRPRTVVRRYGQAIDRLTRLFLSVKMLESQTSCQGGGIDK